MGLAALYAVVGHLPYLAVVFHAVAEAGTAVCLYWLALLIFGAGKSTGHRAAPVVGVLAALAWVFLFPRRRSRSS